MEYMRIIQQAATVLKLPHLPRQNLPPIVIQRRREERAAHNKYRHLLSHGDTIGAEMARQDRQNAKYEYLREKADFNRIISEQRKVEQIFCTPEHSWTLVKRLKRALGQRGKH